MTEQRNNAEVEKLNIGSKVKIKTKFGEEFIGKTFVYDPMTKLVVLRIQF
jgi:small nuclear ribonucleoprotein (snRNP)-like protein